jgi:hypothetical protein
MQIQFAYLTVTPRNMQHENMSYSVYEAQYPWLLGQRTRKNARQFHDLEMWTYYPFIGCCTKKEIIFTTSKQKSIKMGSLVILIHDRKAQQLSSTTDNSYKTFCFSDAAEALWGSAPLAYTGRSWTKCCSYYACLFPALNKSWLRRQRM